MINAATLHLSAADRGRRDKLIGMLGSSFDGERLNALGLLQRMADSYRVPIHELLLAGGNSGIEAGFDRQRAERAEREARDANLRAQRAEQAVRAAQRASPAEPDPVAPKLPPDWRERFARAQQLDHSSRFLTEWEANFVGDVLARGTRWPSPKQAVVIVRILEKAAAFGSRTTSPDADWEDVE
jgi:hypothetical protein